MKKSFVLITGTSSGIGLEFARIFAKKWYNLLLVARSRDKLESLAKELERVEVRIFEKDLSLPGSAQEVHDFAIANDCNIEILINNAGFGDFGYFHTLDLTKQTQMIDLNIRTLTELTYLFGKDMVARKSGKILNVASTAAFQPGPLMAVYFATKHYVLAFSEAIAEEWNENGVTVTTLCPGPTESGFQQAASATNNKMFAKKLPSSYEVALYGYDSLMKGKRVAIHWTLNAFLAFLVRFTPRRIIVKMIKSLQEKK